MTTWIVVEDEPDLYDMIVTLYQAMDIEDRSFTTGEDAIDWIEALDDGFEDGETPELALLDIKLPGAIDGVMVGERMKQSPILRDTIIILMTAFKLTKKKEREYLRRTGAVKLVYKPFSMQELIKDVRPMLQRSGER
jgi:DNA-binding response OmpR family regulator